MIKFRFSKVFIIALTLFILAACSKGSAVEVGETAPDFSLKGLDGKTVNLSDFKGKVVILDFFATWCPPCRAEIPDFIELQNRYGPNGLAIIGVSDEAVRELKDFANSVGVNYTILVDSTRSAYNIYGPIRGIPTTFVIDKEFKIRRHYIGAKSKDVFENDVIELLK